MHVQHALASVQTRPGHILRRFGRWCVQCSSRRCGTLRSQVWQSNELLREFLGHAIQPLPLWCYRAVQHHDPPVRGEKEIAALRLFPCPFMTADRHGTSHKQMKESLIKRGGVVYELLKGPSCAYFDGSCVTIPKRHVTNEQTAI